MPSLQPRWPRQSALLFIGNILVARHSEQSHRQRASRESDLWQAAQRTHSQAEAVVAGGRCPPGEPLVHVGTLGNAQPEETCVSGPSGVSLAHGRHRSVFKTARNQEQRGRGRAVPAQGDRWNSSFSLCSPSGCPDLWCATPLITLLHLVHAGSRQHRGETEPGV